MRQRIAGLVCALALLGATVVTAPAAQASPVPVAAQSAKAAACPWWVANGYWRVIWYWGTGQCR